MDQADAQFNFVLGQVINSCVNFFYSFNSWQEPNAYGCHFDLLSHFLSFLFLSNNSLALTKHCRKHHYQKLMHTLSAYSSLMIYNANMAL